MGFKILNPIFYAQKKAFEKFQKPIHFKQKKNRNVIIEKTPNERI